MGWVWRDYVRRHVPTIAVAMVFMILEGTMVGATSYMLQPMFDQVFVKGNSGALGWVSLAFLAIFVIRGVAGGIQKVMLTSVSQRTAAQLREGLSGSSESYSYAWNKVLDVMRNGWSGPGGASRAYIRGQLWNAIQSEDTVTRSLAARAMRDLPERGLLLRARDSDGVAAETAREELAAELRAETNH